MANEQNLKPFTSDQSRAEAAKNGRKGGIISGEVKRERKTIREMLRRVLDEQLPNDPQGRTRGEAIVESIAGRTFKGGKASDLKVLAEVLGELDQKVTLNATTTQVIVSSEETAAHLANLRKRK